jgi:hypothetical protein
VAVSDEELAAYTAQVEALEAAGPSDDPREWEEVAALSLAIRHFRNAEAGGALSIDYLALTDLIDRLAVLDLTPTLTEEYAVLDALRTSYASDRAAFFAANRAEGAVLGWQAAIVAENAKPVSDRRKLAKLEQLLYFTRHMVTAP